MRSLIEIKEEQDALLKRSAELNAEVLDFQKACPHASPFVSWAQADVEDSSSPGMPIYEWTSVKYTCKACNGVFHGRYDRDKEEAPSLEDIINGKD